jgi:hypothetical protein
MQLSARLVLMAVAAVVVAVLVGMWLWNLFGIMSAPIDIALPIIAVRLARPLLDERRL